MPDAAPTERTRVRRHPERGTYDRATIDAILDEALLCHLAWVTDEGDPRVIPTIHVRVGDTLYVHGSASSRTLRGLGARLLETTATAPWAQIRQIPPRHRSRRGILRGQGDVAPGAGTSWSAGGAGSSSWSSASTTAWRTTPSSARCTPRPT